jgi:hypothetical protein
MKSVTIVRDYGYFAREAFTVFVLAILFLVTGCSNGDYSQRVELAPPPPGLIHPQAYGPPVPYEIAMLQSIENIFPAAGADESYGPRQPECSIRTGFTQGESHFGFGYNALPQHDHDLSFSRVHANMNAPQMMIRLSVALPSAVKKRDCY